ncbi:hypothetical protein Lbir_3140 [Legionella birminghamensis]|uniref:Uncharacterized protein n=1 Tax=Legionella birminghamensis TaxID=28083 RepID=A0A378ID79_9GAMM|nr:helical bundle domain-containing protein [Legionella birminghamensis]KTC66838.1 hypothetical protein Lbir_3140 [Legionella birminghamensis]STX32963.1 Uncharacterised protein [Legionella birminghamensis]
MALTTKDYLDFLRAGDYLRALDWIIYLEQKCGAKPGSGDDLLPIATFELIRYGFRLEDMKHISLLYAAQGESLFKGAAGYGCTQFISAALQYVVYFKNSQLMFYATNDPWGSNEQWDSKAVLEYMGRENPVLTATKNNKMLDIEFEQLDKDSQKLETEIAVLRMNVEFLEPYREICSDYIEQLGKTDSMAESVRLGLVKLLNDYLNKSMKTTIDWEKVKFLLDEIKAQQPLEWELHYLRRMQPPMSFREMVEAPQSWLLFLGKNCIQTVIGCDNSPATDRKLQVKSA